MMGSYNTLNEANILPNSIRTCITLYRNMKERPFDFSWGVGGKITLVLDFFSMQTGAWLFYCLRGTVLDFFQP